MTPDPPTTQDMRQLVAYLPFLYAPGFEPVIQWNGGEKGEDGVFTLPWPDYHPLVEEFYRLVASGGWLDYGYRPEEAARMLADDQLIESASLAQIKTMLTFCVRGERFSDGHWAEMIENGNIRKILQRIAELSSAAG